MTRLTGVPTGGRTERQPLGDLLVAAPSPTRASTSHSPWVNTSSKTDSHPTHCWGQAAAWRWTRAYEAAIDGFSPIIAAGDTDQGPRPDGRSVVV
jgi:hypothetical protein